MKKEHNKRQKAGIFGSGELPDFIIFGAGNYNSLGVLHAMAAVGRECFLLCVGDAKDSNAGNIIGYSRYCKHLKVVKNADEGIDWLIRNIDFFPPKSVIYPTSDSEELALCYNSHKLLPHFIFPCCNSPLIVPEMMNKDKQIDLAEKSGLRILKSQYTTEGEISFGNVVYPCMVKPLNSTQGSKGDMRVCDNLNELQQAGTIHSNKMNSNIIAVIIGIGSYNDLGLIRSCGETGIQSVYLCHLKPLLVPIDKSKYIKEFKHIQIGELLDELIRLNQQFKKTDFVIFGASDSAVLEIERIQNQLSDNFKASHSDKPFSKVMRKDVMAEIATRVGLKIPLTTVVNIIEPEIDKIDLKFPVILKPCNSSEGEKSDITICQDKEEYLNAIDILRQKGYKEILLQDYLHNSTSKEIGITGIAYDNGNVEIHGVIEKIRNRANINNFGIYFPKVSDPTIEKLVEFVKETGYHGIFDTDFIFCNDQYYFIEINYRNGAYGYCTTAAGFNMPLKWIESVCDYSCRESNKPMRDIVFMEERTDILNVLDGTMSMRNWLKDVFRTNSFLWWNRKDMRPFLYHFGRKVIKKTLKLFSLIFK